MLSFMERLIQMRQAESTAERSFFPVHNRIVDIRKQDDFWAMEAMETAPSISFFGEIKDRPPTPHFLVTEREMAKAAAATSDETLYCKIGNDEKRRRLNG